MSLNIIDKLCRWKPRNPNTKLFGMFDFTLADVGNICLVTVFCFTLFTFAIRPF